MQSKIRAHDGIVGATYMLSVILAAATSIQWLWVAGVVAGLQIISPGNEILSSLFCAEQDDARHRSNSKRST